MFLEQQIPGPKTAVIMVKQTALHHRIKLHIKIYSNSISNVNNITQQEFTYILN